MGCTSHGRGAKKVHRDQIALEALVSTYYRKKDGKGEKAVENLTFFLESRRCADISYDQRARSYQDSASPKIKLTDGWDK